MKRRGEVLARLMRRRTLLEVRRRRTLGWRQVRGVVNPPRSMSGVPAFLSPAPASRRAGLAAAIAGLLAGVMVGRRPSLPRVVRPAREP